MGGLSKEVSRDEILKKRAERRKRIRKRKMKAFFVFFVIIALCVLTVLSFTVFFPIEKVHISGSKIYSTQEIAKASGIKAGDQLFAISRSSVEKKLKSKLPFVEKVSFKRELPGTLKITVTDAEEFSCYKVNNKYYTVSRKNWVLSEQSKQPENLLLIISKNVKCKIGSEIEFTKDYEKELVAEILNALTKGNTNTNLIDLSDLSNITVTVDNRFNVNFGTGTRKVFKD